MTWVLALSAALAAEPLSLSPWFTQDLVGGSGAVATGPLAWPTGATVAWTEPEQGPDVVALATRQNQQLPPRVEVPVARRVDALDLAWTAVGAARPGAAVGVFEVHCADGRTHAVSVRLGAQVARAPRRWTSVGAGRSRSSTGPTPGRRSLWSRWCSAAPGGAPSGASSP